MCTGLLPPGANPIAVKILILIIIINKKYDNSGAKGLKGLGGQRHPRAALPAGKTWYPLYAWLDEPQGRSRPAPGFDPRTV